MEGSIERIGTVITLVIVALVEAANEAIKDSVLLPHLPSFMKSAFWNYLPLILLILLGIAHGLRFFFPRRAHQKQEDWHSMIGIQSPRGGDELRWTETVRGFVFPADTIVQVLVYSGDNQWHPQGSFAQTNRFEWSAQCHFGNQNGGYGPHKLIAISGIEPIQGPVKAIPPQAVRSEIVSVARKANT